MTNLQNIRTVKDKIGNAISDLKNISIDRQKIENEIKFFALAGYSVVNVDFNNNKISLLRSSKHTLHPMSLVNYKKSNFNMVSIDTKKQMNKITSLSTSISAESAFNNEDYENFIKNNSEDINNYENMLLQLENVDAQDFLTKSNILFTHFKSVNSQFRQHLKKHLEDTRTILLNAEVCDANFLNEEIDTLSIDTKNKTINAELENTK